MLMQVYCVMISVEAQMMALYSCVQFLMDTIFLPLSFLLFPCAVLCLSFIYVITPLTAKDLQIIPTVTAAFSVVTKSDLLVLVTLRSVFLRARVSC